MPDMIANFRTFSDGLARNTGKLDSIVSGLERMTGASTPSPKVVYDLQAAAAPTGVGKPLKAQLVVPEPSTVVMFDTQRILFSPANELAEFEMGRYDPGPTPGEIDPEFRELRHRTFAVAERR